MKSDILNILKNMKEAKNVEVTTITPQDAKRAAARKFLDSIKNDDAEMLMRAMDELAVINESVEEEEEAVYDDISDD